MLKQYIFIALFLIGAALILLSNIKFAIGVLLCTIAYTEIRNTPALDKVKEIVEKVISELNEPTETQDR